MKSRTFLIAVNLRQVQNLKFMLFALLSLSLIHCSGVKFGSQDKQTAGSASSASTSKNANDASGSITQVASSDPATTTTAPPPAVSPPTPLDSPKVKFVGPPCIRGTNCLVEFDLDAPVTKQFDYDWKTNDTLYQEAGAPAGYTYGQPAVHYVSTSGHITFLPGETVKKVYVQNINPYNIQIIIGVRMSVCTYNGNLGNCTNFFK